MKRIILLLLLLSLNVQAEMPPTDADADALFADLPLQNEVPEPAKADPDIVRVGRDCYSAMAGRGASRQEAINFCELATHDDGE